MMTFFAILVLIVLVTAVILAERGRKCDTDCMNGYEIHESFQQKQARRLEKKG